MLEIINFQNVTSTLMWGTGLKFQKKNGRSKVIFGFLPIQGRRTFKQKQQFLNYLNCKKKSEKIDCRIPLQNVYFSIPLTFNILQ